MIFFSIVFCWTQLKELSDLMVFLTPHVDSSVQISFPWCVWNACAFVWVEGLKADGTWNLSNSLLYLCIFYTCANEKYNFVRTDRRWREHIVWRTYITKEAMYRTIRREINHAGFFNMGMWQWKSLKPDMTTTALNCEKYWFSHEHLAQAVFPKLFYT